MRRIACFLLILLLLPAVCSCTDPDNADKTNGTSETTGAGDNTVESPDNWFGDITPGGEDTADTTDSSDTTDSPTDGTTDATDESTGDPWTKYY